MLPSHADLELQSSLDLLRSDEDQGSEDFADALATVLSAIEAGDLEHADLVAEILAMPGPRHDAALAYKLYYVAHALEGYSVAWANESSDASHYSGPVGDFRNESMVSCMITELGLAALPELDEAAARLLASTE